MRLIELQIERPTSDKNFPRSIMPQIRKGDIDDSPFNYNKENIDIKKLMPVQKQRVKGMHDKAKRGFADGSIRPIVIDKNNYIVNGHHRFDVALQMGIKKLDVLKVNATIEELIDHFSNTSSDAATFEELMKQKLTKAMEGEVITFPGTYVKKDYITINGVKMLKDVWDYMSQDREQEHGYDNKMNTVKKRISNFTGEEDPAFLKKAYQIELRNFIDEFERQDMDPQPFIDELEQIDENFADGKKKGKSRPGRVKKSGASCKGSVTDLRKRAKGASGEKRKMYHWCANMKSGRSKK